MAATAATATYCGIKAIDQKYGTNIAGSLFQHGNCVLNSETLQETDIADSPKETDSDKKKKHEIITNPQTGQKSVDVYAPDRKLPTTLDGVEIPDSESPHTQLGKKKGRYGTYDKAREWGANGKRVKDIDFTDHRNSQVHPTPHQHIWEDNETGGSLKKDDGLPLENWNY